MKRRIVFALAALAASAAHAQVQYRSVFADYKAYREPELAPWREVNDQAKAVGGHAGAVKPAAPKPPAPEAKPPAGGQMGQHR